MILAIAVSPGPAADIPDSPWVVYPDESALYSRPDRESEPVRSLAKGDTITGEYHVESTTDEEWIRLAEGDTELFAPRWDLTRVHPANRRDGNIPIGEEVVNRWWGLPIDYEPNDLVPLPNEWRFDATRDYPLREEVMQALTQMLAAAHAEGISIRVNSAYRSGPYQEGLYTRAVRRSGPKQRYSAPPGHSEHQLGTCVDLTDVEGRFAFTEAFGSTPEGQWLEQNAARFGFRRSYYPHNTTETGYISEPWHWRYWRAENLTDASRD